MLENGQLDTLLKRLRHNAFRPTRGEKNEKQHEHSASSRQRFSSSHYSDVQHTLLFSRLTHLFFRFCLHLTHRKLGYMMAVPVVFNFPFTCKNFPTTSTALTLTTCSATIQIVIKVITIDWMRSAFLIFFKSKYIFQLSKWTFSLWLHNSADYFNILSLIVY